MIDVILKDLFKNYGKLEVVLVGMTSRDKESVQRYCLWLILSLSSRHFCVDGWLAGR